MKNIFIDLETTGLEDDCEIVEAGINFIDSNGNEIFLNELFNVKKNINIEASMAHGFINEDLIGYKYFKDSDMFKLLKILGERDEYIFIAHNIKFDARVLERYGIKLKNQICTYEKAKNSKKIKNIYGENIKSFSLQYLRYFFKLDLNLNKKYKNNIIQHRTKGDIIILKLLYNKLLYL